MSNVAVDLHGNIHYADDFSDTYNGPYFCPNPDCHIPLTLKNLGTDLKAHKKRRPYFSAGRRLSHIAECPYRNSCISYQDLEIAAFRPEDFFRSLLSNSGDAVSKHTGQSSGVQKENKLTTLNKLYHYCIQHRDSDTLPDGTKIFEIFQDDRNKEIYASKRHPYRMIKLRFRNCNFEEFDETKECYKIWCLFPHSEITHPPGQFYTLGFHCDDVSLMKRLCERLAPLKKRMREVFILVGGEWIGKHCYITSMRQIYILQNNK